MIFVADASVALSWCFVDEATPETRAMYALALANEIVVPPLWHVEVANTLGMALRRKRIEQAGLSIAVQTLHLLKVTTVEPIGARSILNQLTAMETSGLTAYDALYLQLAVEQGLPLASFDNQLITSAKAAGVSILHLDL